MDIVSCTDTNFVIPLGVMIHSLCVNNEREKLHFHIIIDDSVTDQQKDELRTVVSVADDIKFYLVDIENIRQYLVVKVENFPVPIYYRLLMAKILPDPIHTVLYLDADIIVRHDLTELWNTPLDNVSVAAIPNQSDCGQYWDRLDYPKEIGYFNSGVLLLNLDYIRSNNLTDVFINYIKDNPQRLLCPDQDVLNYVLKDCKIMLPVRYNSQEGFYREPPEKTIGDKQTFESDISDPYIVHYTKEKPWMANCSHPLKNLYYYYKADTIWANNSFMEHFKYKKTDTSFGIRVKLYIAKMMRLLYSQKKDIIRYKEIHLNR